MQRKRNARENQKTKPPLINTTRRPRPTGTTPQNRTQPKNKLTVYLVDIASADQGDKALRQGPKQNLEQKAKPNF
jgi:hypothetical protein